VPQSGATINWFRISLVPAHRIFHSVEAVQLILCPSLSLGVVSRHMRLSLPTLKQSSSSKQWLSRQSRDPYVNAASGLSFGPIYRARSAHKLVSLSARYPSLLRSGNLVVDLGAAPGGWSQVSARKLRGKGMVWAVDLLGMDRVQGVEVIRGDFLCPTVQEDLRLRIAAYRGSARTEEGKLGTTGEEETSILRDNNHHADLLDADALAVDTVLSDMMAPMSGVRLRDVQASLDLVMAATTFANKVLRPAAPGEEVVGMGKAKVYPGGNLV
jgi:23S rRNA (uridine2552-2'-O)-methyltransferase